MRGYQKRVIYMKNTGSSLFEEAYFIIRSGSENSCAATEAGMVEEANRIIKENIQCKRGGFIYRFRWHIFTFFIGAALSFLLSFLIFGL